MADQHHAAPVVVMGEIGAPRRQHVLIGQLMIRAPRLAAHRGHRGLPIERGVGSALGAVAGQLLGGRALLLRARCHVRVGRRLLGHRGVDVEAIDRRGGVGKVGLPRHGAVRRHDRRGQGLGAHVGPAWTA